MAHKVTFSYGYDFPWLLDVICETLATDSQAPWHVTITRVVDEDGKEATVEGTLTEYEAGTPDTDSVIVVQPRKYFDGELNDEGGTLNVPEGPPLTIRLEDIRDLSIP